MKKKTAREAIALVTDAFTELSVTEKPRATNGPIGWDGYDASLERARETTGESESVVCGTARIGERDVVLIAFEFAFLGGSLGEATGDRLVAAHELARRRRLPVVSLIATGGSRMQEGMHALSQLQRITHQTALTRQAGLAQLAVLRDPSTGGGWAVLGPGSDLILALPGSQVGFAGSRVRPPGADAGAYTAESQLAHGHIDAIVPPEQLRDRLADWLALLANPTFERPEPPRALGAVTLPESGWQAVMRARDAARPHAADYLDDYFDWRCDIGGDRCGGVDPGMLCGFGRRGEATIAYAAQTGGANSPAGFRTAARLLRLADRLDIPVLTLIDTPGAANGAVAERGGVAGAIAEVFTAMAEVSVPVTSLLIGHGGSGGAMALAAPGNTWTTPEGYFAVITPESATAILKRGADEAPEVADRLRLRAQDLAEHGIVRGVVT